MSKNTITDLFYSGTSGLVLPFNKTQYPADFKDKSRLQYYSSLFKSVEINSVFYKLPKKETVTNWTESVPKDFRFTFKVPKVITHVPKLDFKLKDLTEFIDVVEHIGDKKGCLLAQFPPSITIEKIEQLKNLLETLTQVAQPDSWKLAIEFRNSSWYEPKVQKLLSNFNATMVLHDMKNSATAWDDVDADFIYLRFHGPEPRYRGSYNDKFLKERAESISKWILEKKTVYAYFNNSLGDAFLNLQTLDTYVHSKKRFGNNFQKP
ncbi:MAG: DUF72 domain-containing protein [Gelidibacter sp.]